MGFMIDGKWDNHWYDTDSTGGSFKRMEAKFRNWITADGSPGPSGQGGFKAEPDRYHLYVSLACPWAHRTLIFRKLKGLEEMITVSVVNSYMGDDEGWTFYPGPGVIPDFINHKTLLHEVYSIADPNYTGIVSVPTLWDKKLNTIVSNESSEIIRMLNSAFDGIGALPGDYYPNNLREEIDQINEFVYHNINNGVYKAGFATNQKVYEKEAKNLFQSLDELEKRLSKQRYLVGDQLTEADWRLFTTLIRFDSVYVGHFKCNLRRLVDYPNLWNYTLELAQIEGIMETIDLEYTKAHYYGSHDTINPTLIVPIGPELDLNTPHNRNRF
ncbi:glutathione S-transferase family protein [Thiomicrorhabdus sp. ZW0627]|uniref:glutathione S-transferase family protein n=1 Tax=Thiomicrorhabdus sp. ZW0627 TaxID=3039774 RepID=UPI002436EC2E|nr:glutathione S-transferase family protein [Thiomicrorhabdus sp. ZW0627]MDG6774005.1 glutathione S-transferase family protein [Thiomicrorhabdus sp. ZW0627]